LKIDRTIKVSEINPMARQLWAKFRKAQNCQYVILINKKKAIQIDRESLTTFEAFENELMSIKDKRTE
jgi:hypothetical protein